MTLDNKPWSQKYREAASDWVDKEAAAKLLEETKSAVMAQKQSKLGDIPVNRAEQIVKASDDWYNHIEKIVEARRIANLAWVEVEYIKMRFNEFTNEEANHRAEARL